jgi:FemAB-related protein (PEP-CTERM system-associated)
VSVCVHALEPAVHARWDAYLERRPGSNFASRTAWKTLVERWYGCRSDWRYAERSGEIAGVLPLFAKPAGSRPHELFSAPGGLLADDEEAARALLDAGRQRIAREGLEMLELRDQLRRWDDLETRDENCTLILELAADRDRQWKAFDAKLRNQVRKAEKSGIRTRWGRDVLDAWHRVMLENMRDLGTPLQNTGYFRAMIDLYGDDVEFGIAELNGRAVAALTLVRHGDTCVNPWASSLRATRPLCPNHLLFWDGIGRAIDAGLRRFDFGRSQWQSRTFDFKRSWGAEPVPLFYQYVLGRSRQLPSVEDQKHSFALAVRIWQRLPLAVARTLGPIARRRFPEAL